MKKLSILFAFASIGIFSCTEQPEGITKSVKSSDTSYLVSPVPAADPHNVLFEDFTGASCPNCPPAKRNFLDPAIAANPGRINVIALHINGFAQAFPVAGAKYDFRTDTATKIGNDIFGGISVMPIGGIDRFEYGNGTNGLFLATKDAWPTSIATQLAKSDSFNLALTSTFNSTDSIATIVAKVTYLYKTTTPYFLSLAMVEDSLVDKQEDGLTELEEYDFEDVLRMYFTPPTTGDSIAKYALAPSYPEVEPGRVFEKTYKVKVRNYVDIKHCKLIGFINRANGRYIQQSASVKISQ